MTKHFVVANRAHLGAPWKIFWIKHNRDMNWYRSTFLKILIVNQRLISALPVDIPYHKPLTINLLLKTREKIYIFIIYINWFLSYFLVYLHVDQKFHMNNLKTLQHEQTAERTKKWFYADLYKATIDIFWSNYNFFERMMSKSMTRFSLVFVRVDIMYYYSSAYIFCEKS